MSPAVVVDNRFECSRDAGKRPGNTHHRVVDRVIVQNGVATVLREVRAVPVGHNVTGMDAH